MSTFNVLIPVDGSPNSEKAFDWYVQLFHKQDNLVHILHVHETPSLPTFSFKSGISGVPAEEWKTIMESSIQEVKALEDRYVSKCQALGIKHKVISVNGGPPGEYISNYAKEQNIDMITMGTRGRGTIRRTILGSVSDYVLHHSRCPISVVPGGEDARK